ncbi:MAG: GDSL-type esterase/lipase family protein, partial [Phycisphaerales bacterium]
YEPEIAGFEAADAASPPAPGQVLFIGSSSIRMWKTLADDMAPAAVLNRGFGGSKTPEVLAVMDRIVYPYDPAAIVYYCGDNDLGDSNTDSAAAADGFITFAERVHERWPGVPILYLSIKPSLARWSNWAAMDRANALVAGYAADTEGVEFVDVGSCLLGPSGAPQPTLYVEDGLHLSPEGYARWTVIVRPRVLAALHQTP